MKTLKNLLLRPKLDTFCNGHSLILNVQVRVKSLAGMFSVIGMFGKKCVLVLSATCLPYNIQQ